MLPHAHPVASLFYNLENKQFLGRAGSSPRQVYGLEQFLAPKTYIVLLFVMFYQANPFFMYDISHMRMLVTSQKLNRKYFQWRSKQCLLFISIEYV